MFKNKIPIAIHNHELENKDTNINLRDSELFLKPNGAMSTQCGNQMYTLFYFNFKKLNSLVHTNPLAVYPTEDQSHSLQYYYHCKIYSGKENYLSGRGFPDWFRAPQA